MKRHKPPEPSEPPAPAEDSGLTAYRAMVRGMTCIVVARDPRQARDLLASHAPAPWAAATLEPAGEEHLPPWPCVVIPSQP